MWTQWYLSFWHAKTYEFIYFKFVVVFHSKSWFYAYFLVFWVKSVLRTWRLSPNPCYTVVFWWFILTTKHLTQIQKSKLWLSVCGVLIWCYSDLWISGEFRGLCLDGYNYLSDLISIVGLTSRQDSSMESNFIITVCAVINTAINLYKLIVGKKE